MRKLFFVLSALLCALYADAQDCIPVRSLSPGTLAFRGGEELSFVLHYNWGAINADVGKAAITIDSTLVDGVPCYHIKTSGRTARFYDVFFKVRECFESWVRCEDLRPVRFSRDTHENTYTCTNRYLYRWDYIESYAEAYLYNSKDGAKVKTLPLGPCIYDLPTLYLMARNADFSRISKGVPYPMNFIIDDDRFKIFFTLIGDDTRTIKGIGTLPCKKFAVSLVAGEMFEGTEDLYMWLTDDANRLPVWFEAPFKIGNVSGRVESIKGQKFPLRKTK